MLAFTCPVCLDDSETKGRLPLTIPCGHSTCSACLKAMEDNPRDAEMGILCPTCRSPFGPVASLRPSYSLLDAQTTHLAAGGMAEVGAKACRKSHQKAQLGPKAEDKDAKKDKAR